MVVLSILGRLFRRNWHQIAIFLLSVLFVYFGDFHDWDAETEVSYTDQSFWFGFIIPDKGTVFMVLAVVLAMLSVFSAYKNEKNRVDLKQLLSEKDKTDLENQELSERLMSYFSRIVRDLIQQISDIFEFEDMERITIYKVEDHCFWPIARVSENTLYRAKSRSSYPRGQGCISKAWEEGECHYNRFPEHSDEWIRRQEETWSIPANVGADISMKSRSMFAYRFSTRGQERTPLAVFVFESMRPQKISVKNIVKIKAHMEAEHERIERILLDYHEFGPSLGGNDQGG